MGTNRLHPKEMVITTTDHQHTFGLTQDITTKVSSEPGKNQQITVLRADRRCINNMSYKKKEKNGLKS